MEKEIKVRLSTVIYLFIIFGLIIALGVVYYLGFVSKEKEINNTDVVIQTNKEKNNIIGDEKVLEENTNESTEYIWEKYPENCRDILLKAYMGEDYDESDYKDYFILENGHDILNERLNTLYSLWNKYSDKDEFPFSDLLDLYVYDGGDSTEIISRETNYDQYLLLIGKNISLKKYSKPITYKMAIFNEFYDISLDKEPTLEERTTAQSKDLKSGKKDYHYDDIIPDDRNFYYEIPELLVMNGNNTNEDDYKNNARAKKIKVTFNNKEEYIFDLKDTNEVQIFDINYKQNTIATPVNIEIEVLEKYSGEKTEDVYISDIQFSIESNIPQGR